MTMEVTPKTPLLPCPFCGADAAVLYENASSDMAWVSCIVCGLEAPSETGVNVDQAVDYWNNRPDPIPRQYMRDRSARSE